MKPWYGILLACIAGYIGAKAGGLDGLFAVTIGQLGIIITQHCDVCKHIEVV